MRREILLKENWTFTDMDGASAQVNIPHTWNAFDGQDGGNDYRRGTCSYEKVFSMPDFDKQTQRVYLEFDGVNVSAEVTLNGNTVMTHHGGYSLFRCDITEFLAEENCLRVAVDNSVNDYVYPQKADFTFYGGIYRDVKLLVVNKYHFDLDYYGGNPLCITATIDGKVRVRAYFDGEFAQIKVRLLNAEGVEVAAGMGRDVMLTIENPRLWNGVFDPYLYTCEAELWVHGELKDYVNQKFGIRFFSVDNKNGFILNGNPYPLRGVCRHQDWKGIGNALGKEHHEADMALIREVGANCIRLAHYQHDQYFYDLCDRYGIVVWAEIPYISEHMENGFENTVSQMKELIVQNYNHPSICVWGISNEITISTKNKKDMLRNHRILNDLTHQLDPTRLTALACYAVCSPFNKVAHITDLVGWNLYLGWYVPGLFLNDLWVDFFHSCFPNRPLGYSEYGCEGMPNLHSARPRRGDHSEEYQAKYHEYLIKFIEKRPFLWGSFVWNMFDFAADAREQGGEPGMNHKGLVTFDRQTKKDSFYLYKAWWTTKPFVHICGKRFAHRTGRTTKIKVYSNAEKVTLYADGEMVGEQTGRRVFTFKVNLGETTEVKAVAENCEDTASFRRVAKPDPAYRLGKSAGGENWTK